LQDGSHTGEAKQKADQASVPSPGSSRPSPPDSPVLSAAEIDCEPNTRNIGVEKLPRAAAQLEVASASPSVTTSANHRQRNSPLASGEPAGMRDTIARAIR